MKPGWKCVRFDRMVTSAGATRKARGWSGTADQVDRYVGLEHLDSNSLKIRRWGSPADVGENSDLRLFEPGDVILARRRIYQRKIGVAEFRGVASGHALVFRAMPDVVLPDFLPFFMQSDAFMERADRFSAGSLSGTVNLSTLMNEEFVLPPLEEQRRAVEAFRAAGALAEAFVSLQEAATAARRAWLRDVALRLMASRPSVPLGELLDGSPDSGCSAPERDEETGYWVLGLSAMSESGYVASEYKAVERTPAMLSARLSDGDLLITRSNTRDRVGFVGRFIGDDREVSFPDTMMRLHPKQSRVTSEWLELILQASPIRGAIQATAAGTSASMKKINRQNLLAVRVPDVPRPLQGGFVEALSNLRSAESSSARRATQAAELRRSLVAEVLGS